MDTRLVIEVFSNGKIVMLLLMNNRKQFSFDDDSNLLFKNDKLFDWIKSLSLENLTYYTAPASETDEQRDKDVNYGIDKDFKIKHINGHCFRKYLLHDYN